MAMPTAVGVIVSLAATFLLPVVVGASEHCSGLPGCKYEKIAVVRCETDSEGSIKVRNSSVTGATGVTVQRGDRCAATVSALLQSGLKLATKPTVTASSVGPDVSFSFVFAVDHSSSHDGLYVDDDDDDDNDDDDD